MKRILTSVVFVVLLFPALALGEEVVDWDDLVNRDGIYYIKFTDVPFTGKTTGQGQGLIVNGQYEGPWFHYYDNGRLLEKGDYKNGEKEGTWVSYWVNGQLMEKTNFKNGEKEGAWVRYYDNGQLHWTGTYKNNVKVD
tara:strand:- start:270 stop:683 length:414 start_codon:yes stop_codon:yes gene_type:complete